MSGTYNAADKLLASIPLFAGLGAINMMQRKKEEQ